MAAEIKEQQSARVQSAFRHWLFRGVFYFGIAVQVVGIALTFPKGFIFGYWYVIAPLVWGTLFSVLGLFARPRLRSAVVFLSLEGGLLLFLIGYLTWTKGIRPALWEREYEKAQARQQVRRWVREELIELVKAGSYEDAKVLLRKPHDLRLDRGKPWGDALCPADKRPPDLELLQLMGKRGAPEGGDLLAEAAKCSLTTVREVLKLGIPATASSRAGHTGLMRASTVETMQFFLDQGVKLEGRTPDGATALMFHRSPELTKFLLDHGADVHALDKYGRSALHYKYQGAFEGRWVRHLAACYELILQAGADPNLRARGTLYTPLLAMANDHEGENKHKTWIEDAADVLVEYGADPMLRDRWHGTALQGLLDSWPLLPDTSLSWPGFDLQGTGGADLLVNTINRGYFRAVYQLLDAGANPLAQNFHGVVPLSEYEHRHGRLDPAEAMDRSLLEAAARFGGAKDAGAEADAQ